MTHLTETELVDLIDGRLAAERARHVDACAACRAHVESLRVAVDAVRTDQVPEPSPLFWASLTARVADAIDREPAPSRWRGLIVSPAWRLAVVAAVLVLAAGVGWQLWPARPAPSPTSVPDLALANARTGADEHAELDAWDAMEALAQDLDFEDAQSIGIASRPGSAERMVGDLSDDERAELARLIEEEMKRNGA